MSANWSTLQRHCLVELGYVLYEPLTPDAGLRVSTDATGSDQRLLRSLLRAAGCDPATVADPASWMRAHGIPLPAQLRGDPAAKRALWPRLRCLRRERHFR